MADLGIQGIVNYTNYPIADLDSSKLQDVIQRARCQLKSDGIALLPQFMTTEAIQKTVDDAMAVADKAFRGISDHNVYLEECSEDTVGKDHPKRILCHSSKTCITNDQIPTTSPVHQLYLSETMTNFVRMLLGKEALYRTADFLGALNIHVYYAGDQLNWHFDRGEFAVTLLLQAPHEGGNFQYIPSIRSNENENHGLIKQILLASEEGESLTPLGVKTADLQPGTLVIFSGHNSMHCITPISGSRPRILTVLSYETKPAVHLNEYTRMKFFGRLK